MAEKPYVDDDDKYSKYSDSAKAMTLWKTSAEATNKKEAYLDKIINEYTESVKDAKIKDLSLDENAKKYLDGKLDFWDENLEFNVDNFYEPWVEKVKFKARV